MEGLSNVLWKQNAKTKGRQRQREISMKMDEQQNI